MHNLASNLQPLTQLDGRYVAYTTEYDEIIDPSILSNSKDALELLSLFLQTVATYSKSWKADAFDKDVLETTGAAVVVGPGAGGRAVPGGPGVQPAAGVGISAVGARIWRGWTSVRWWSGDRGRRRGRAGRRRRRRGAAAMGGQA
jgi:hypothetical protein